MKRFFTILTIFFACVISCKKDENKPQLPPPTITSISATSGVVGDEVTITGTNFDASPDSYRVTFGGVVATIKGTLTNTSITAVVPAGASTGAVTFANVSGLGTGPVFTVLQPPTITGIAPASAAVSASVTITGTNFSTTVINNIVKFGNVIATVTNSTATSITAIVPSGVASGVITVATTSGTATSSVAKGPTFTTLPTPTIASVNPLSGIVGTAVTITGTNLGTIVVGDTTSVMINGVHTKVTGATTTLISVEVPKGASSGHITISTAGLIVTSADKFTVIPLPVISSIKPTSGPIGTAITIKGTGFSKTGNDNVVSFGNVSAMVTYADSVSIVTYLPAGVPLGKTPVVLTNSVGKATTDFTVTSAGGCTTAFVGGTLLYSFDTDLQGWASTTYAPEVIAGNTVAFTKTDGHTCPGVAEMVIPFASYGQQTDIEISPSPPLNFTGKSKLHFWIKTTLQPGGTASAINGINFFLKTSPSNTYFNSGNFIGFSNTLPDGGKFSDGNWHEYVFNIAANSGSITVNDIRQFGVQIVTQGSAPSGGPATPPTVTLHVDDFWLE